MSMSNTCDIISVLSSISGNEQTDTVRVGSISNGRTVAGNKDDSQQKSQADSDDHQGSRCQSRRAESPGSPHGAHFGDGRPVL